MNNYIKLNNHLKYCKVTCFTLKLEAAGSPETLINFYLTVWCHIPEDGNLIGVWDNTSDSYYTG
jgi:hypothetical protein